MAKYIEKQSLIEHIEKKCGRRLPTLLKETIQTAPAADVVEVVRCKDCKNCENDTLYHDYWCRGQKVWKDHYCGYAERREE